MSTYISLEKWPEVNVDYKVNPSTVQVSEFFTIMELCFQIAEKNLEKFIWNIKLHKGAPSAPVFGIKFVGWLISNKANITKHIDHTNVFIGDQSMKKWMDLILGLYTPSRPVHVIDMPE